MSYVHLQTSTSSKETLEAKVEYERHARSYGVSIQHYHADNGRFADNEWREDVVNKTDSSVKFFRETEDGETQD
jgi:hypothetical protein